MYKEDLALNNLPCLICHKTILNQIIYIQYIYKEDLALNNCYGVTKRTEHHSYSISIYLQEQRMITRT